MIMRFSNSATKVAENLQRLARNSIVLSQPDGEDGLAMTTAGVRVTAFQVAESGRSLETNVTLRFEKDRAALIVSCNPELLAILGYAPGIQAVVTSESWPKDGDVLAVALSDKLTPAQTKAIEDLEYLLDLHVVVVGLP